MITTGKDNYSIRIARIDLAEKKVTLESLDTLTSRYFLGGAGILTYFLLKEIKPGIDALSPENKLIFATGPLTGVPLSGTGRHCVGAKSPLTGGIAKSEAGGFWGSELRRAGIDVLIIENKASSPVYLWVHDGEVDIRDAQNIWGKDTGESQKIILQELGDPLVRLSLIGQAGENLVRFACIMTGLNDAAGRGGTGCVMGSKNLKAIAVRGHQNAKMANPEPIARMRTWLRENKALMQPMIDYGTGAAIPMFEEVGNLPVHNYRDGLFPGAGKIDAITLKNTFRVGMEGCFACIIKCKKIVKIDAPYSVDSAYGGPEYETLAAFGSNCGVDDLAAICKANEMSGSYSLDTISTGNVIAFAMECYENGLLTRKDTGGIDLKFGNTEAMLEMIDAIAARKGIGAILAEGTNRAAEKIGNGAKNFLVSVKRLEPGLHDPRFEPSIGFGYMVNPHGADHCNSLHDSWLSNEPGLKKHLAGLGRLEALPVSEISPRKVALFKDYQMKQIINDSAVLCQFLPYNLPQTVDLISAVTGWDTSITELMRVAERTLTGARLFNIREGFTAKDDQLPLRFFQPKTSGTLADKHLDRAKLEQAKQFYYALMGWDKETGIPLPEKLEELRLPMC